MFMNPVVSQEDRKLIGHLVKKKKQSGKYTHVYYNKKDSNNNLKYVTGEFYSAKNKAHMTYRSSYELKFLQTLESNDDVERYASECFTLPYINISGVRKTYIPDLLVVYKSGKIDICEIKPKAMLVNGDVQRKAAACRQFIISNFKGIDCQYKFVTEDDLFINSTDYSKFLKSIKVGKEYHGNQS
jgi:hypothetical protein